MLCAIVSLSLQAEENTIGKYLPTEGRDLTMADVFDDALNPENREFAWIPDGRTATCFENGSLVQIRPDGTEEAVLTAEELMKTTGNTDVSFVRWLDADRAVFKAGKTFYIICIGGKTVTDSFEEPENAANFTFNPLGFHVFTADNSLYFCDSKGNVYPIAESRDRNITYGQYVSRNEFGITGGIFLSPDGKKVAFYRKDESAVGTFPLLDINSRTGSLLEVVLEGSLAELLEELLGAGFPEKAAIRMLNAALVMGREEIHYSTVDMTIFDLYTGTCEIVKAGASSTFIKKSGQVEHLSSSSLPIGVVNRIEIDAATRQLDDGDFVIMVTDGVLDALPVGEQDILLETIIQGTEIANPKEMAHHVLEQVLAWTGKEPADDMTVMAVGIWRDNSLHLEMN